MDTYTLKQLLQATDEHDKLPDRALKCARQVCEHAYGDYDRVELLKSMAGAISLHLPKNKSIPAPIQVSLIKKLYGKGCPLERFSLYWQEIPPASANFITAMYYLAQTSTYRLDLLMRAKLQKVIAEVAFAQGKHWDALRPALESVDGLKRSYRLLESVPDLLTNLHKHLKYDHDAVYLQRFGGVERLKDVGADLSVLSKSFLKHIAGTRLSPHNLAHAHQLILDMNQDLLISGQITRAEMQERCGKMIVATSEAMARKVDDPQGCYQTILTALAPLIGPTHASEMIPRLTQSLSVQEIVQLIKNPLSKIDPPKFKRHLKKHVDVEKRYDLVVALGVQEVFTRVELNTLKGEKLESAMGL
jgi:hypothetical protein